VGEALGIGGRGARRRGGTGRRRQGRWREGEVGVLAGGGAAQGVAGSSARRRGRRGVEEAGARCQPVRGRAVRGQESRGRSGGARSGEWHGFERVAWASARAGSVSWARGVRLIGWTVGSR
jgi:hypothetical protein